MVIKGSGKLDTPPGSWAVRREKVGGILEELVKSCAYVVGFSLQVRISTSHGTG